MVIPCMWMLAGKLFSLVDCLPRLTSDKAVWTEMAEPSRIALAMARAVISTGVRSRRRAGTLAREALVVSREAVSSSAVVRQRTISSKSRISQWLAHAGPGAPSERRPGCCDGQAGSRVARDRFAAPLPGGPDEGMPVSCRCDTWHTRGGNRRRCAVHSRSLGRRAQRGSVRDGRPWLITARPNATCGVVDGQLRSWAAAAGLWPSCAPKFRSPACRPMLRLCASASRSR
jgi:hypothetical protein